LKELSPNELQIVKREIDRINNKNYYYNIINIK
jgi:hypothetical protein